MRSLFLPFERMFDEDTSSWCLTGHDRSGGDFGGGAAADPDEAAGRLRGWVVDSLLAAAGDGAARLHDLVVACPKGRECLGFWPARLLPVRIPLPRARPG